jgi:hypothetical protein
MTMAWRKCPHSGLQPGFSTPYLCRCGHRIGPEEVIVDGITIFVVPDHWERLEGKSSFWDRRWPAVHAAAERDKISPPERHVKHQWYELPR